MIVHIEKWPFLAGGRISVLGHNSFMQVMLLDLVLKHSRASRRGDDLRHHPMVRFLIVVVKIKNYSKVN
jgi:hypothetical protein